MPDYDSIGTTLAARYAAAAITPPPGLQNVRLSTPDLPSQLTMLPCVLVFWESSEYQTGNGTRIGTHDYTVRFYLTQRSQADLSRDSDALQKWGTVLVDQLRISAQLGGIVAVCRASGPAVMGLITYAGTSYSGIEIPVSITTSEAWLAVS